MKRRVILICGGREFADYDAVLDQLDTVRCGLEPDESLLVIHGGARGADRLAHQAATERCVNVQVFPADWDGVGRAAGFRRNEEMAHFLVHERSMGARVKVFAFPGGNGTAHMVSTARRLKLSVREVAWTHRVAEPTVSASFPRVWNKRTETPPASAVYVGRPTRWGNPFSVEVHGRDGAVRKHAQWLLGLEPGEREALLAPLRGKELVCWCAPAACHAYTLAMYADEGDAS